jgi:maltose/moltooligosaccharide transporter
VLNRQRLAFLGCSVSIGVFNAFNNFTLSLWLTGIGITSYILIGLLSNSKSLEGAIISPISGALSDRTWAGWLGRRRPFILVGGLAAALLLALTPAINRMPLPAGFEWLPPEIVRFLPVLTAIFLFTLAFNVADDVYHALLPDLFEGADRNWMASLSTVADIGAQFAILLLFSVLFTESLPDSVFAIAGGFMAAGVLLTVLGVREPQPGAWEASRRAEVAATGPRPSVRVILTQYRGAAWFLLAMLAYWSGVNAVLPLISLYTRDILGASNGEAQLLPALLLLSTAVAAIPMGWLGTRFGKRRVISAGLALMAIAALAGLFVTTKEMGALVFVLAGVGNAGTIVLRIPLLADLVPRHHMGVAVGFLAASGSVAAPFATFVAGGLADMGYGPRAAFAVMAAMTCVAIALMPLARKPNGPANRAALAGATA